MARAVENLAKILPRLPDFYATRTTTHFSSLSDMDQLDWKSAEGDRELRFSGSQGETIRYRNGDEEGDPVQVRRNTPHKKEETLDTRGTFASILYTVVKDGARSTAKWSRWEQGTGAPRAVFSYSVPRQNSSYSVSFCCMTEMNGSGVFSWITGYHGELAIDAETGAIVRATVQADLEPHLPLERADIMVSYHPVDIGGKTYICPRHSVAISRKRTVVSINEWDTSLRTFGPFS